MRISEVEPFIWEIEREGAMRVPARFFASPKMVEKIRAEGSIEQVCNGAALPGIEGASLAMPDMHFGYGLPIGGVVATRLEDGGGVEGVLSALFNQIPCGVGVGSAIRLNAKELKKVLKEGAAWAVKNGMGGPEDLECTEERGAFNDGDPTAVSDKALERGRDQLGTLGSGNHFLEIQYVDEIINEEVARGFGLFEGQVTVMLHTGSRGLGHQVCTDALAEMGSAMRRYEIQMPDRQLACVPIRSEEGRKYLNAMRSAANFAWANRQIIAHQVQESFAKSLRAAPRSLGFKTLYDLVHNIVKFEEFECGGERKTLAVHRKGATRAFPPGHKEVPEIYRSLGQPILVPGDMGRASYILAGTQKAFKTTFGSCCHGAGRVLSRAAAKKQARGRSIVDELASQGVSILAKGQRTIVEEMPDAYKDISEVIEVVSRVGLGLPVARLKPLGVMKG
jgi:tRNA-splicing ligase RtcB